MSLWVYLRAWLAACIGTAVYGAWQHDVVRIVLAVVVAAVAVGFFWGGVYAERHRAAATGESSIAAKGN